MNQPVKAGTISSAFTSEARYAIQSIGTEVMWIATSATHSEIGVVATVFDHQLGEQVKILLTETQLRSAQGRNQGKPAQSIQAALKAMEEAGAKHGMSMIDGPLSALTGGPRH